VRSPFLQPSNVRPAISDGEPAIQAAIEALAQALMAAVRSEVASAPVPERLLSIAEAATALGLGRSAVYRVIAEGHLQSVKIGRRRLVPAGAVARFINEALGTPSTAFSVSVPAARRRTS
jgi:excisionase family DNA binding protein